MSKKRRIIVWLTSPIWIGPALAVVVATYSWACFFDGLKMFGIEFDPPDWWG